ncbi:NAD-dependent epimerase/dehydratase family protein, partial [candidate division WOR-3 bacterium]|nr:NAD-dependent epimerase/dehydratase family protein [candidate division WOR-3 bacterium]
FNRGKTNPDIFPEAEHLIGNRDSDLKPLCERKWDAVVDTCGYVPRIVKKSSELLANNIQHYTFISSLNAYSDFSKPGVDEDSPLATIEDKTIEEVTGETYGPLKVLCEKAAEKAIPGKVLTLRCGLIVGPYDPSDRFTYWPVRINQGGEVLAPSPQEQQTQFIDARDISEFILLMAERKKTGVFNTVGPDYILTMQQLLEECNKITGNKTNFTWVSEEFLTENETFPPVWLPKSWVWLSQVSNQKAISAGLTFRSHTETIKDTLSWHTTRPKDYKLKTGLSTEREKELLEIWHHQKHNSI